MKNVREIINDSVFGFKNHGINRLKKSSTSLTRFKVEDAYIKNFGFSEFDTRDVLGVDIRLCDVKITFRSLSMFN